jgi:cell wall-associated NlpC family hydrolase
LKTLIFLIMGIFMVATLSYATPDPASVKAKKKPAAVTQKYKVRSGDNLSTIARRYGMKLAELKRLNGLKDSRLKIGQTLIVSGKAKPAGKVHANVSIEESRPAISRIALPNAEGLYDDSLETVGVEPIARTYLSIPYRYGAQSRNSTDCSGFVQQVFREFDINLPRTAREQYTVGMKIDRPGLASGDLLFFRTRTNKKYPTHVGIYLGNGKMIHASSRQRKVVISDVNHPYYVKRYVGAKRTATFLPGEIDLEMLARQVTGAEVDSSLISAIASGVSAEREAMAVLESELSAQVLPEMVLEAGYADGDGELGEEGDDIDDDVEPEAEAIIPVSPRLGTLPLNSEEIEVNAFTTTTITASRE